MKVLVIFSYKYSLKIWKDTGNIDRELQLYKLLNREKNVDFTFFTYGNKSDKKIINEFGEFNLITFSDIFKNENNILIKSLLIPLFLKKHADAFDIIKCIQLNGAWVGILLKLLTKKPLYIKTGFDQVIFSIKEKKSFIKRCMFYFLTQIGLMSSDLYTVASKHDRTFIEKNYYLFDNSKLRLRPNWVEILDYNNPVNKFENKIISIGRLSAQKNYSYLISALKNSNISLEIIGSGELLGKLKEQAIQNNVKVNFLGNLRNKQVVKKLKQHRYFVIASIFEGNPKVILEAMSSGCVVIASDIPNNTEIIDDGVNGFTFDINDKESKILQIIKNSEELKLYEQVSKKAIEYVKTNNSLKNFSLQEINDYKFILNIN